ncbi:MAG TPA: hypothetical protein VLC09_20305, partial [Polyangiaceae bacterium]|nr:hypothetical protein [Polyangiaceae bacterium]
QSLSEAKAQAEASRDASIAALEVTLAARTEERDSAQAATLDRDGKIAQLEAELAACRSDIAQLKSELSAESNKLSLARDKWTSDSQALGTAKQSLAAALAELDAALGRPIS